MSWSFRLSYLFGKPPWDTQVTPPEVRDLIESDELPAGRALDLGCGTGTNCIYLAHHGWETIGVDFAPVAIRRARRKAKRARVQCRFHVADVTDLSFLIEPFDLLLDIGCLHSLPPDALERYAAEVIRLTKPAGCYMLYAFAPHPDRRRSMGLTPEKVRSLFTPAFAVENQVVGDDHTGPPSAWYWLRRAST
jgi:SAM-dependent methyltransferase